ncbi:TonB-dependent receptor [Steroidobacter sp.]|uniref:TonB-dependent receptor n=1 Tax=Steroidobacter sp. TaxID=1978227 RepID=UPI001A60E798|nr:TonB-dependent receptor [Steroidobacter sp.]MBL8269224.1 TonB-dependent receptor [Steroidobacter sp.]
MKHRACLAAVLIALAGCLGGLGYVGAALADDPGQSVAATPMSFDIPRQPLSEALAEWSRQSGLQVLQRNLDSELHETIAIAVAGQLSPTEALRRLLENTGLSYEFINDRTVRIAPTQTTSTEELGEEVTEVVVQSRRPFTDQNMDIVRTTDDVQPYQILTSEKIERSGAVNVEDFLKQNLTMNATAQTNGAQANNYLGNTSSINLRGLGANQTLILINGRRSAGPVYFGATSQPDINGIPLSAIDRIETLPTSASAIYGGAALAGVVNVVLKHDYQGGDLRLAYDTPTDGSASRRSVDGAYGMAFEDGKTHVMLNGYYSESDSMHIADRPELASRGLNAIRSNYPALISSTTLPYSFGTTPNIVATNGGLLTLRDGTPLNSAMTYIPSGFTAASDPAALVGNAGSVNYTRPDITGRLANVSSLRGQLGAEATVKSFGVVARRQMTENLEAFAEFFYASNSTFAQINPVADNYRIPSAAPTNPFQQAVTVSIPTDISLPYQASSITRRAVIGAVMDLPNDWRGEADYTWSSSRANYGSTTFDVNSLQSALNAGTVNPFVDTLNSPLDLSPYYAPFGYTAPSSLDDFAIRLAGPLPRWWAGAPTLAIGLGHRKEGLDNGYFYRVSPSFPSSSFTRYVNYLSQSQTTDSVYLETLFPLLSAANGVPGIRALDLQIAVRTERYNVDTGTGFQDTGADYRIDWAQVTRNNVEYTSTNPTLGLRYKPIDSVTFRASYATAFLPPAYSQIIEGTQDPVPITVIDPQRGFTAVTVNRIRGGNPDLEPQESTSWNFGVIFEPEFLKGARFNLEWYRIEQTNVILTPTPQQIIDNESQFAGRVQRGAAVPGDPYGVGAITLVDYSLVNANESETEGFDFTASYRWRTQQYGSFVLSAQATRIESYKIQNSLGSPLQEIVNQVAYGAPLKFRSNASLIWYRGPWSAGWAAAYFDSYPQYSVGTDIYVRAQGGREVSSQVYHDLSGSYRFDSTSGFLSDVTLQFGVKNLFDQRPPLDVYFPAYLYSSPFGDSRLRSVWASLGKRF